jgi:hypothetical protein
MKMDIIPNINDPSLRFRSGQALILPYDREDGQGFQFENPSFSPAHRRDTKGFYLTTNPCQFNIISI